MEEQLFVRIRGRVQGPYSFEKLRTLVRRGQLSRMHEVSSDKNVWKQASEYPDLFASSAAEAVQVHVETQRATESSSSDVPDVEPASATQQGPWYYSCDGTQKGPTSFDQLKTLANSGSLGPNDLVWTDGMNEWMPAHTIAGLQPYSIHGVDIGHGATLVGKVDREVVRTLAESRPWAKFIAFAMLFVAALGLGLGPVAIVMGARWNDATVIASGGFSMFYGGVFLWGSRLLSRYCSDISKLVRDPSMRRLDVSLRSLRRFWIFLSIIWIVVLVNAVAAAIWAISIGVSLSGP